jgi:hypothetical protein
MGFYQVGCHGLLASPCIPKATLAGKPPVAPNAESAMGVALLASRFAIEF